MSPPGGSRAEAEPFRPYVPASEAPAEFTLRAVLLGATLSVLFGMVNAYLGLKIGLTVSASIPSAVISMAVLRGILRRGTILENNVVHAVGSTGESLAAGVVFTVPALLFLDVQPSGWAIFVLGAVAGLLGLLTMIPLRRDLMIREHETLPFPEGTACAAVLVAGDRGGASARPVFQGMGLGLAYLLGSEVLGLWRERISWTFAALHKATIGFDLTPIFLGVGTIIGPRIAGVMAGGGVLAWCVLVPLVDALAGTGVGAWLGIPASAAALDATGLWKQYVRYVGAGAVAMGGLLSLVRVLPSFGASVAEVARLAGRGGDRDDAAERPRTERDLPRAALLGIPACALVLWAMPELHLGAFEVALAVAFSSFFVVVSARIVGLVGTTSQPVSGMTITALLATSVILALLGHRGPEAMAASITVGAVVAISIALAGDLAQDLKTAALIGATPSRVQLGQIIGTLAAAARAGWVLLLLHQAFGLGSEALPAPQARLMATLVRGVAEGQLPLGPMLLGAALAGGAQAAGIPSLVFAIGLYLPITTTAPLLLGGLVRAYLDRRAARSGAAEAGGEIASRSTLLASGMIAGEALSGIAVAGLVVLGRGDGLKLRADGALGAAEPLLTVSAFLVLVWVLARSDRGGGGA